MLHSTEPFLNVAGFQTVCHAFLRFETIVKRNYCSLVSFSQSANFKMFEVGFYAACAREIETIGDWDIFSPGQIKPSLDEKVRLLLSVFPIYFTMGPRDSALYTNVRPALSVEAAYPFLFSFACSFYRHFLAGRKTVSVHRLIEFETVASATELDIRFRTECACPRLTINVLTAQDAESTINWLWSKMEQSIKELEMLNQETDKSLDRRRSVRHLTLIRQTPGQADYVRTFRN